MKRTLIIIVFFIIFLLIFFLQSNFFNWYNIAGIKPNLYILFVLFIGLFLGRNYGFFLGIFFGFILDLFVAKRIGINSIMLGFAGLIGGIIDKNFSKDNKITFILMTMAVTVFCETIGYTLQIIMIRANANIIKFLQIVGIETIFNVLLSIILYPLIQKSGNKIEEIFDDKIDSFMRYY